MTFTQNFCSQILLDPTIPPNHKIKISISGAYMILARSLTYLKFIVTKYIVLLYYLSYLISVLPETADLSFPDLVLMGAPYPGRPKDNTSLNLIIKTLIESYDYHRVLEVKLRIVSRHCPSSHITSCLIKTE